jgi:uncharacterized DUF497 family protein
MNQDISFDPAKSHRNEVDRGLPFYLILDLEWSSALIKEDRRRDYGERRFQVLGIIHGRFHAMVFTQQHDKVYVIRLRKANDIEVKHHAQTQNPPTQTRH